jgi:AraC-like DNA-binding protein
MTYRELPPPRALESHVACVWWRDGSPPRVLPDACADIVWIGDRLIVAGPATRAAVTETPTPGVKLGVRFRVGGAARGLGLPADELRDLSVELGELWPEGDELSRRVGEADGAAARMALITSAVAARLDGSHRPDPLVRSAARDLARPGARVSAIGREHAISERQLRRRFERETGYSPRTLARVLRLQRFLALAERDGPHLARLAADAGYSDQAHLTRECQALAGLPAAALLASGAGPAGERLLRP